MSQLPQDARVAIVGAGATGLVTALGLAQRGVQPVIVDRSVARNPYSRAFVIQARTLEALEKMGVVGALLERGLTLDRNVIHNGKRKVATIRLDHLPTKYPYTLVIPQNETECVLETALREAGVEVQRDHEVTGLAQDGSGVTLTFATGRELRADYLLGADGMHSRVREACGIPFTGLSYSATFVLADLLLEWTPPEPGAIVGFLAAGGPMALAPFPGGLYRLAAPVDAAAERPSLADMDGLVAARGPRANPIKVREVVWSTRFRAHCRHAARYREGRVFLAGDSAHVHSPIFGHGMNLGIQDGINVAGKLADVVMGADPAILDSYEAQRRPVTRKVIALTDRGTRLVLAESPAKRWLRARLLRAVGSVPYARNKFALIASELAFSEQ